ncbi:MAG: GAF domain-containing protein [Anaerolineae bacterium]|nr:GAF domain-containing protein [Anaerolineae bacterium]
MDTAQKEANVTLEQALRRANLLAAAAEVSQNITHIMDIDELLPKTVDIICDAYDFYYSGVFLIDEAGEFAVLRAGRGEPGRVMIENNHKLAVGGNSMIGACTALNEARISLDVDTEKVWYPNPVLPETRSEMALPLAIGERVIGAVTVQSVEAAAFSDEDVSSLQAMANQLAIALDNARQRQELEETHAELLRAKTFEAIATATGDAIHWIGNKAEPIGGSVERIRHDIQLLIVAAAGMLPDADEADEADEAIKKHPLAQLLQKEAEVIRQNNPELAAGAAKLNRLSPDKLQKRLSLASIMEDLEIIEEAGRLIMRVKEDMIGPAREQAPRPTMIDDVVKDVVSEIDVPADMITIEVQPGLPLALADPVQLNRVFVNLIKNAYEAMENQTKPHITLSIRPDSGGDFVLVDVTDNGSGIPEDALNKIWITFHTTKGIKGHTGLGLPACRLILEQIGGHISVTSQPGRGSTFTVSLPVFKGKEATAKGEMGRGKILLIDDDDHWRNFAVTTLEDGGYKVATSGDNYRLENLDKYDLILIDDILAQGSAQEIMQTLKNEGAIAKTVAVSTNPRVERTKERKLLGVHNLILKPHTRASLLTEVKSALKSIHSS